MSKDSTQHNPATDLHIAQAATLKPIEDIAARLGLSRDEIEPYGRFKAKIPLKALEGRAARKGRLVLVTAITPTPAGEGKTTVTVGLADGLNRIGKQAVAVLREPSLGPVFGMKGGATGGGHSQLVPMEDINLHFNGDFAAIEKANNLLSAMIDNNIYHRERNLGIDPRTVRWKWAMDMNVRSLRHIVMGLDGRQGGFLQESGFHITAASEVMAILCLARDRGDLKERLGQIYVGDTFGGEPVFARDLNAHGAMAALLKDAIKPNLVQTLEGNPAIVHGGPFANIAQGTNSLIATKMGLGLADFAVTEAGFGADLGAEKFFNIKCRAGGLTPSAVVLVATIRALKYHGGVDKERLGQPDPGAVRAGLPNLDRHIENIRSFGLPLVVAINKFAMDTAEEQQVVIEHCRTQGIPVELADGWAQGGPGMEALARRVAEACAEPPEGFEPTYPIGQPLKAKIEAVARQIYGAGKVVYSSPAEAALRRAERLGFGHFMVCMAKTQYSFSEDPTLRGRPLGFALHVREVEIAAGAGFIVPIIGKIMRMPGLPVEPAAERIDIDTEGRITGLF